MPRNHKQILEEAFLPDVWGLIVRFLDSNMGAQAVVLAALMTRTYVGPAPFLIISGLLEAGFGGSYLDNLLKKHIRQSYIKEELLPVADLIIKEISTDNLVKSQLSKIKSFAKELKRIPLKSREAIVTASRNLKTELENSEKILATAIDKAMNTERIKNAMATVSHERDYIKKAILSALSITQSEIKSLLHQ